MSESELREYAQQLRLLAQSPQSLGKELRKGAEEKVRKERVKQEKEESKETLDDLLAGM